VSIIRFEDKSYQAQDGESLLDCLLRHELEVPNSCRNGICQTCLMRAVQGTPTAASQKGLKPALVQQNCFLPCSCVPTGDMEVALPNTAVVQRDTEVIEVKHFTQNIVRLRLARPQGFDYCAGQFLTLFHPDGHGRSYSLASLPELDRDLEFHVRRYPDGQVSGWIAEQLQPGDRVSISEAIGECVYIPGSPDQPLLLVATGTGLAPLYGVLREALHRGHEGMIKLYHGSRTQEGLYLHRELHQLAQGHPNLSYIPCISGSDIPDGVEEGRANEVALQQNPDLKGWRIYICGAPDMVYATKRSVFLAGASMQAIHSDPFVYH
jgi:ferredoxin-NADP reductase/ferredoxin